MEHVIDAAHQPLGRISSRIASILQGKHGADYNPRLPGRDRVTVKNAAKIIVSGRKATEKKYYRHTGYMGHLRVRTFREAFARAPDEVLRQAVAHMLPKNRLRMNRLKRLLIER